MSFTLADLTDTFFDTVVLIEYDHSSGLGGPGAVYMITNTGKDYFLPMEGFEHQESELAKYIPLLAIGNKLEPARYRYRYLAEDNGWKWAGYDVLIRDNYYKEILSAYEKAKEIVKYPSWPTVARQVINPAGEMPVSVYAGAEAFVKAENEERAAREQYRASVRLTEEDLKWKQI